MFGLMRYWDRIVEDYLDVKGEGGAIDVRVVVGAWTNYTQFTTPALTHTIKNASGVLRDTTCIITSGVATNRYLTLHSATPPTTANMIDHFVFAGGRAVIDYGPDGKTFAGGVYASISSDPHAYSAAANIMTCAARYA